MKPYKYAFWNNKGGVGKTFLCFAVASEYALQHPDVNVVIIDMCPQANVSEILLGGNGSGGKNHRKLVNKEHPNNSKTIGGYYSQRINRPHEKTETEKDFLIQVREFNRNASENLHLIAGDSSLEMQVKTINQIAAQGLPLESWRNVRSWVKDLQQEVIVEGFGEEKCAFFIDCNPSFSSYTEQALLAVDRLIVPCTPDGSSARAIDHVGQLVYGNGDPSNYEEVSFNRKAKNFSMTLPKIHLVAMNRFTTNRKQPAKAFNKMFENIKDRVRKQRKSLPSDFTSMDGEVFINMPDAHTAAIVASYTGKPIRKLRAGKMYDIDGDKTTVNQTSLSEYQQAIQKLVSLL